MLLSSELREYTFVIPFALFPEHMKILGFIRVDIDIRGKLLMGYSALGRVLRKKWKYDGTIHQLYLDFEKLMIGLTRRFCIT
jgi:hypothetical protein